LAASRKKIPVFAIVVREFELVDVFEIRDFRGKKIAVLVADLRGRALHVDESPTADGGLSKRALQTIIRRGSGSAVRDRNGGYDGCDQERAKCNASTHLRLQIEERNYRVGREFTRRSGLCGIAEERIEIFTGERMIRIQLQRAAKVHDRFRRLIVCG